MPWMKYFKASVTLAGCGEKEKEYWIYFQPIRSADSTVLPVEYPTKCHSLPDPPEEVRHSLPSRRAKCKGQLKIPSVIKPIPGLKLIDFPVR